MQSDRSFNEFIGIDVSKDWLDTFNSTTGVIERVKNSEEAINEFIKRQSFSDELLVVIDLTGGYEEVCVQLFSKCGYHVHRAEGRRVKSFLRAMNQKAKTDVLDAIGLAQYGEKMQETLRLYVASQGGIKAQVDRMGDLKTLLQMERNRLKAPAQKASILEGINRHIEFLEGELSELEAEVRQIISSDELMSQHQKIMTSVTGVGEKTSMVLLAHLPELGRINRRKIAALSGLAPFARDSGKTSGYRTTKGQGGRPQVKKALFICALVAIKHDPKMKLFYDKLCSAGKKKMVAITAVMRKMLIIINAKSKSLFQVG